MKYLTLSTALLAGCSNTAWQIGAGQPHLNSQVQVHASSGLATVFGLTILAAGAYEAARSGFADSARSEMAPDRKVSEQDCTKPLDYSLGNIRCK